jgi:hypothetical protein
MMVNSWTSNPDRIKFSKKIFWQEQELKHAALASGGAFSPTVTTTATEEWTRCWFSINSYNNSFLTFTLSF